MDGGIEKEGINISLPFQPKQTDIPTMCNLKTQKYWISNDCDVTNKEGCTRQIISLGENPGLEPVQQGKRESEDSFTAKLPEIDRSIDKFEGEKGGTDPVDSELHNNMPLNLIVFSSGFSNLEGKAGGVESSHELPEYVELDGISVKVSRPSTIGPRLGKTTLSLNGLDVGQSE